MQDEKNKIRETITTIYHSDLSAEKKIEALNNLLGLLTPANAMDEIILICNNIIAISESIDRTEMLAQTYLVRAKSEICKAGPLIAEMKNLNMAIDWFGFALESERERYKGLDKEVKNIWKNTQADIDNGFQYLAKKPYIGATAYCYKTAGEIYGQFYLQLKLYYFFPKITWFSSIANFKIMRFLDIDDLLFLKKESREHLNKVRNDCYKYFEKAIKLFEQEESYDFLADCYLSLSFEHHSFENPIRCKIYLYKAEALIKKYNLSNLVNNLELIKKMPLIGSGKDKN